MYDARVSPSHSIPIAFCGRLLRPTNLPLVTLSLSYDATHVSIEDI